ncbi:hypothetical protein EHYA_07453 [Embleya hyalina]|uniref:Uncharacterized protein n=1 Tax=Embleya hyalina TaxID=516124 RepID=A0A401YYQ9_9ACTN|nr:hypothetical protein EHYA_07453 [Embleya hyalina]
MTAAERAELMRRLRDANRRSEEAARLAQELGRPDADS